MSHAHISSYLNDHLAGSVTALELLANLASAYAGTDVERLARELRAEVSADRDELELLMKRLDITRSAPRQASAWLAEKVVQIKLRLADPTTGPLRLLETAEALSVGVEAKRLLWRALAAASVQENPELRGLDYPNLDRRAEDQRRRLEIVRVEAAKLALTLSPGKTMTTASTPD